MDNDEIPKRYVIGINTISLEEADATMPSAEEIAEGDLGFADVLRSLSTDKQRFIALCLYVGFNKAEIATILGVSIENISQITKKIQIKLVKYRIRYHLG